MEGIDEAGAVPSEGGSASGVTADREADLVGESVPGSRVERSREWTGVGAVPSEWTEPVSWASKVREQRRERALADTHTVRVGGRVTPPRRGDGWQVTAADEALLRALARYGTLTFRQARDTFYEGVQRTALRRLERLRDAGWVRSSRDDGWAGVVLWPTAAGVSVISDSLRVPISAPRSHPGERLLHALCIADVGLRFEQRGVEVFTEREVRFLEGKPEANASLFASLGIPDIGEVDGAGNPRRLVVPVGAQGRVHYPDLVTRTTGGLVAIEVETTPKSPQRLNEVLRAFAASRLYQQVVYFATDQVQSQLVGTVSTTTGEWVDGAFQNLRMAPEGPWSDDPHGRYRVRALTPTDEGAAYRLDMRQAGDGMWVPKRAWRRLREQWRTDREMGKPVGVPFLRWWFDVALPAQQARERAAAHSRQARLMSETGGR